MNTTTLFVELIVIGVGALVWVALIVFSALGWQWFPIKQAFSTQALPFVIAVIYLLGIVTDRIADATFESLFGTSLRQLHFPDLKDYHRARLIVLSRSERLAQLLEYGRSRLRISRGWALNSLLIAVCMNIFLFTRLAAEPYTRTVSFLGTLSFILLSAACWYSWKKLVTTEYIKTAEQSSFLQESDSKDRTTKSTPRHSVK